MTTSEFWKSELLPSKKLHKFLSSMENHTPADEDEQGSSFALIETFVSTVEDLAVEKFGKKPNRIGLVFSVCMMFFLLGLIHATRRGLDLLDVFDRFATSYYLLFGVAMEGLLFTWFFGFTRMTTHIKKVTYGNAETPEGQDMFPTFLWRVAIPITMPVFSLLLFLNLFYGDVTAPYGDYEFWLLFIGWSMLAFLMILTPLVGFLEGRKKNGGDLPPLEDEVTRLYQLQNIGSPAAPLAETEMVTPGQ